MVKLETTLLKINNSLKDLVGLEEGVSLSF